MTQPTFKAIEKTTEIEFTCTQKDRDYPVHAEHAGISIDMNSDTFGARFTVPAKDVGERMAEEMVHQIGSQPDIGLEFGEIAQVFQGVPSTMRAIEITRSIIASAINAALAERPKVSEGEIQKLNEMVRAWPGFDRAHLKEILAALGVSEEG